MRCGEAGYCGRRVQELDSQVVALREDLDLEKEMHVNDVAALQEALADAEEVRSATSEDLATLRSEMLAFAPSWKR